MTAPHPCRAPIAWDGVDTVTEVCDRPMRADAHRCGLPLATTPVDDRGREHDRAEGGDTEPWHQRMWDIGDGLPAVTSVPGNPSYATAGVWVFNVIHPGAHLTADQADALADALRAAAADQRARSALLNSGRPGPAPTEENHDA